MAEGAYTEYGFDWGPMSVTRCCELPRGLVVQIKTEHASIDVYVTKAGRKIRVFDNSKEWPNREMKTHDV